MMEWNDGWEAAGAGWIVVMCLMMLASAGIVAAAIGYAARQVVRDRS